jgi:hypothetical protein
MDILPNDINSLHTHQKGIDELMETTRNEAHFAALEHEISTRNRPQEPYSLWRPTSRHRTIRTPD